MRTPEFNEDGSPNPKYKQLFELYTKGSTNKGARSYYQNIYNKAMSALRAAQENNASYGTPETAAALAAAERAAEEARRNYENASLGDGTPAFMGGTTELPADFVVDQQ